MPRRPGKPADPGLRAGAQEIIPLALGAAIYGLAFGFLAASARFSPAQVGIMGASVFAGGAQIVATQRLASGAGALAACIAGLALNLRLLLFSASIRDIYAGRPWWQIALGAHLTTDENWARMLSERARGRNAGYSYFVGAGLTLFAVWLTATVIGATFAAAIPDPKSLGLDFAFTAAFIAIVRSLWKGPRELLPWITSLAVVAIAVRLTGIEPSWALLLGGLLGSAVAGMRPDE